MARIRADYVLGTTDAALSDSDTTLSSPGLANLPAVTSPDIAAVTLFDGTDYEIVHVTAHTASATTATITRGQEGSTAQAWASGATWRHGPTEADFGAQGLYRGEWEAATSTVEETFDFADDTWPTANFTKITGYTPQPPDVAVQNYAAISGGPIPDPPAKMVVMGGGAADVDYGLELDLTTLGYAPDGVRFWYAVDGGDQGKMSYLRDGVEISYKIGVTDEPWEQYEDLTLGSATLLRWKYRAVPGNMTSGAHDGYLARVEMLSLSSPNYAVNDLVLHDGGLWSCVVANTTSEPGTNGDWAAVALSADRVTVTPAGGIAATDVQGALTELDADKVSSLDITTIDKVTQAEYDALGTPDPNTLYVIVG